MTYNTLVWDETARNIYEESGGAVNLDINTNVVVESYLKSITISGNIEAGLSKVLKAIEAITGKSIPQSTKDNILAAIPSGSAGYSTTQSVAEETKQAITIELGNDDYKVSGNTSGGLTLKVKQTEISYADGNYSVNQSQELGTFDVSGSGGYNGDSVSLGGGFDLDIGVAKASYDYTINQNTSELTKSFLLGAGVGLSGEFGLEFTYETATVVDMVVLDPMTGIFTPSNYHDSGATYSAIQSGLDSFYNDYDFLSTNEAFDYIDHDINNQTLTSYLNANNITQSNFESAAQTLVEQKYWSFEFAKRALVEDIYKGAYLGEEGFYKNGIIDLDKAKVYALDNSEYIQNGPMPDATVTGNNVFDLIHDENSPDNAALKSISSGNGTIGSVYNLYPDDIISDIASELGISVGDLFTIADNDYLADRKFTLENGADIYLFKDGDSLNVTPADNDFDYVAYNFIDKNNTNVEITQNQPGVGTGQNAIFNMPIPAKNVAYTDTNGNTTNYYSIIGNSQEFLEENYSDITGLDVSGISEIYDSVNNLSYINESSQANIEGQQVSFKSIVDMVEKGADSFTNFMSDVVSNTVGNINSNVPDLIGQIVSGLIAGEDLDDITEAIAVKAVAGGALDATLQALSITVDENGKKILSDFGELLQDNQLATQAVKGAITSVAVTAILKGSEAGIEDYAQAAANSSVAQVVNHGLTPIFIVEGTQAPGAVGPGIPTVSPTGAGAIAAITTIASSIISGNGINEDTIRAASVAGGTAYAGMAIANGIASTGIGATLGIAGSVVPIVGTVIGAALGVLIGSIFKPGGEFHYHNESVGFVVQEVDGKDTIIVVRDQGALAIADANAGDIIGGNGHDVLVGDDNKNLIVAQGGDDMLEGRGDEDILIAGSGNDHVEAGDSDDYIEGNEGKDKIHGDDGDDMIIGGSGHDILSGGTGNDQIEGNEGEDLIYGDSGDDVVWGGANADQINGGAGNDLLYGDDGDDYIDGSIGDDQIYGGAGHDVLFGSDGNDVVRGDSGDDIVYGDDGIDVLYGDLGDDILDGGKDADLLFGGLGKDVVFGQDGDDHIYGELDDDYLVGGQGNDILDGGDGSDVYAFGYGDGKDVIMDSSGTQDIIRLANYTLDEITFKLEGNDVILSATPDGSDEVRITDQNLGNAIEYLLLSNGQVIDMSSLAFDTDGNLTSYSVAGISGSSLAAQTHFTGTWQEAELDRHYMFYNTDSSWYTDNFDTAIINNSVDMELYNDVQVITQVVKKSKWGRTTHSYHHYDYFENNLMGTSGSDRIVGLWWDENLEGRGGNDQLYGNGGEDFIDGGTDHDIIFGGSQKDTINANDGNDKAYGGMGDDVMNGNAGNDALFGEWDNDTINGGADDDLISGGMGNDILSGDSGHDIIYGDQGNDFIEGNDGNDYTVGGEGNDTIEGGSGDDYIEGGKGDDILQGGYTTTSFIAGSETLVNSTSASDQYLPAIGYLENGGYVITWASYYQDGSAYGVFGQLYDSKGNKIGNEFQANTYTSYDQHEPDIAGFKNGGFVVSWSSYSQQGSKRSVHGQIFDENGNKVGGEIIFNTNTNDNQRYSDIIGLENGNFVVVWNDLGQDGSGWGVYGQVYNEDGNKIGGEFLANTYTNSSQEYPSVTSTKDGGFVVVWTSYQQDSSGGYGVYGQRFNANGSKVGSEFHVPTTSYSDQYLVDVAGLESGGYVVTWQSYYQDGSAYGIFGQMYNASGQKVGGEFQVNTYTSYDQNEPAVAGLQGGGFVVSWSSYSQQGSKRSVHGQIYDEDGNKVGGEVTFNDQVSGNQRYSDIVGLENGGFAVTWNDLANDGSGWGVYQKLYSPQNNGADGNDILRGGDGNDTLYGHAGDDLLVGGEGADYINGGDGVDTVSYFESDSAVNVNLATGVESGGHAQGDTIADVENVIGSDYDDVITGNSSANTLEGGYGNDNISGGDGNDIILGGAGSDVINGGSGWDTVSYADSVSGVEIDISAGTGKYGHADGDTLNSIEYFIGSDYDDRFVLSSNNSNFAAGEGEDTVVLQGLSTEYEVTYGNGQISAIHIASGTVYSFADVEKFAFDDAEYSANDFEGGGDSVAKFIEGNTVSGIILDNVGNDTISVGSDGSNGTVTINGGNYTYVPNSSTFTGTDQFTIKVVDGDNGSIHLQKVDVEISVNSSVDTTLEGTSGNDVLQSGDGNDVLTGYAGADILDGGAGIDTADYSTSFGGINVNLETGVGADNAAEGDELTNIENITGSAFDDTITGDSNDNVLIGADGSDTVTGGLGNDDLQGGEGLDKAVYAGNAAGYGVTLDDGQIEVVDTDTSNGDEGIDTLTDIEQIEFADSQFTLADFSKTEGGVLNVLTDNNSLFVAGNDTDTFTIDTAPAKGSISFNTDGTALYQPNASETGTDSFSYVITNALGLSKIVNVTVDISGTPANTSSTGNDSLLGAATDDVLDAGDGSDVIETGTGNDTVVIRLDSKSKDVITDFDVASDKVDLADFDFMFDSFAELMLQISDDGNDTTIDFGNGQTVVLKGVTKTQLTKDNFVGNVTLNALPVAALTSLIVDIDEVTTIDVLAQASDLDGDVITLDSLGSTANPNSSVAIVNGEIVYTPETGFTGSDSFEYTISDNQGGVITQTLNITVEEVNDAPTGITLSSSTLAENADGAIIGDLTVADIDTEDSHTFTVDDARFEVVNGQLKLVDGQSLDFETEPTVDVNVTATDLAGESTAPITFTLTITDANDAPTGITLLNNSITENADGAIIGDLTVADVDVGDSHTFTVDDTRFEVVNGQLKLVDGQSLDYETEQTININIIATDGSGASTSQIPFTLNVTDVAEIVVGTAAGETITGYGGGMGKDIIYGLGGNDLIATYEEDDYIEAGAGNDTVFGGEGDDIIEGQVGNDILYGGEGNDFIRGGYGVDHMQGDAGIDTFVFTAVSDSNATYGVDTIHNFEDGTDLIDLSALDSSGISSFSDLTVTDDGSVTTIKGNSNNFELKLNGVYTIDDSDFIWT